MEVLEVASKDGMESLRADWDAAFALDPHASPFMSWAWHRGWLEVTPFPWMTLAARESPSSPFVGFLPISLRGSRSALRIDHLREVHAGGEPTADEAGFVCVPAMQDRAISALADHLFQRLKWDRLRFQEWNDSRLPTLLSRVPSSMAYLEQPGTACPWMKLPETWDEFLRGLSSPTRQSLRRRLRTAEREFRLTIDEGAAISDPMIAALIGMAARRTRLEADPHVLRLETILRRCANDGLVRMVTLWKGGVPAAGVAGLIDRKRGAWCLYVTSFDEALARHSPGRVAIALAIRDAIVMKMESFDFLRGEEPYKFQFGAQSRHNRTLIIERPSLQAALRRGISGVRDSLRI
ncbi:MAG TPA: GNAT family N-acetyltransferase [Phycisphaerales bacterium]|nr:GNAT family N-acetyltransferase [Phycisphaerales bacterium]